MISRRTRRLSLAAPAAIAALALGACGSAGSRHLALTDAGVLRADLSAARAAADGGNRAGALASLDRFAARVERLRVSGRLSPADARALAAGAAQALDVATRELPGPVAPVAPVAPALPAPPAREPAPRGHGHDHKGDGHGKGHHDEGGGGDQG
jgi:hypothetical protein